ncbi:RNA polymerase sigma factor [Parapedobacter sp. 10938]|uniref:RNA polymerase sigma factor n=1 Tax=Parapedobacter flavus TaxID=3110225 RepID=UPI002DBB0FBC|nr:sigma-70 family RNA polymerase sigma factor [Parapedobacter sp. 10938]MEC3879531.1 sigma-70 family RNA polymerase sigma factor [Parapedobacter sp. 10938]
MSTLKRNNDELLLRRLVQGDREAYKVLYHSYSRQLLWRLEIMLKDSDEADDLLQELFIKVWTRREQIDPSQSFEAYLHRIARHMVVDHYRRKYRTAAAHKQLQLEQSEVDDVTTEYLDEKGTRQMIDEAIELLSPQCKLVFQLCKLEGKSHKEAAAILNISPHTVNNHLVKGMQVIKEYLRNVHLPLLLLLAMTIF